MVRPSVSIWADSAWPERRVSAHARQQLFEHERLGQVVVGPCVEGADFVARVVARREHQDWKVGAPETDAP
jgi:hypothetical protein